MGTVDVLPHSNSSVSRGHFLKTGPGNDRDVSFVLKTSLDTFTTYKGNTSGIEERLLPYTVKKLCVGAADLSTLVTNIIFSGFDPSSDA